MACGARWSCEFEQCMQPILVDLKMSFNNSWLIDFTSWISAINSNAFWWYVCLFWSQVKAELKERRQGLLPQLPVTPDSLSGKGQPQIMIPQLAFNYLQTCQEDHTWDCAVHGRWPRKRFLGIKELLKYSCIRFRRWAESIRECIRHLLVAFSRTQRWLIVQT